MLNNNTAQSLLPNIILDSIGIGLCGIACSKILIILLLILFRYYLIKEKDRILFLLSLNMYINVFIFACFTLDMFTSMLIGHLNPDIPTLHDNTLGCRLKIYTSTIALISALYSNALQGFYRYFRIRFYTRPFLYNNIYLYLFAILIQIILSASFQLPVLLPGHYDYEDYHCQVYLTNWRGILTGACLVWLPPVALTIAIYIRTMNYIRSNSLRFTLQQKIYAKRDVTVIKRVLFILIFIILFGMPAVSTTVVYLIFNYVGWWANHLTWLTFVASFTGMTCAHTYHAKHIHTLYFKRRRPSNK